MTASLEAQLVQTQARLERLEKLVDNQRHQSHRKTRQLANAAGIVILSSGLLAGAAYSADVPCMEGSVLCIFTHTTPARASEVNHNFEVLAEADARLALNLAQQGTDLRAAIDNEARSRTAETAALRNSDQALSDRIATLSSSTIKRLSRSEVMVTASLGGQTGYDRTATQSTGVSQNNGACFLSQTRAWLDAPVSPGTGDDRHTDECRVWIQNGTWMVTATVEYMRHSSTAASQTCTATCLSWSY